MFQGMSMSKMAPWGNPEFGGIAVSTSGAELSEVMSSIRLRAHKGAKGDRFRGNAGKNIKRVGGNGIEEVRDDSNAIPGIRSIVGGCISGQGSMRKSRGRVRM